jgi:chromosome segregation ATPase
MNTPSVPDKLTEVRKLNEEIAKLKSTKEKAEQDATEAVQNVADLQSRRAKLELELQSPDAQIDDIISYSQRVLNECTLAIRTASDEVDSYLKFVKKLSEKVSDQIKELEKIETLKNQAHENILVEEKALAVKKNDLDIYAQRLQQKIDTYKLADEIKLI